MVPIPDHVTDPRTFTAKAVELFSRYPAEVMTRAAHTIPERASRPTIALMKVVLDELHAPILREAERRRAAEESEHNRRLLLPRPKRTPEEQVRIDAQVAAARQQLGIPPEGLPPKGYPAGPRATDTETTAAKAEGTPT